MKTTDIYMLEKDVKDNKHMYVYMSSFTTWWTHRRSDIDNSSIIGNKCLIRSLNELIKYSSGNELIELLSKKESLLQNKNEFICDPIGSPLNVVLANDFICKAKSNPSLFGKKGIEALMYAHSDNCNGICFRNFSELNIFLDKQHKK